MLHQAGRVCPLLQAPLHQGGHHPQGLELTGQMMAQRRRHPPQQSVAGSLFVGRG